MYIKPWKFHRNYFKSSLQQKYESKLHRRTTSLICLMLCRIERLAELLSVVYRGGDKTSEMAGGGGGGGGGRRRGK